MTLEVPEAENYLSQARSELIDKLHSCDWMKALGVEEFDLARLTRDVVRTVLERDCDVVEIRIETDELRSQLNQIIEERADELAMLDGYLRPEDY